jgi:hypothetical protein
MGAMRRLCWLRYHAADRESQRLIRFAKSVQQRYNAARMKRRRSRCSHMRGFGKMMNLSESVRSKDDTMAVLVVSSELHYGCNRGLHLPPRCDGCTHSPESS